MTSVNFDRDGYARGFAYHDGALDGVLMDQNGRVAHFAFRSSEGEQRVLTLTGVVALSVSDFRQGNIIANIQVVPARQISHEVELGRLIGQRLYLSASALTPDQLVFRLESSYGAEIVGVCEGVELSETGSRFSLIP